MATLPDRALFNLKAVVRETGVAADTLRAWERRYGLPEPSRSPSRQRMYSARDLATIRWLTARQAEGLSISRAVALWRSFERDGLDPLEAPGYALPSTTPAPASQADAPTLAALRQDWLRACGALEEDAAERALAQAFALYPPEQALLEVLAQGLARIGDLWYSGELGVQQEHFATALAMRRLQTLLAAAPPPSRPRRLLVACAPGEQHAFAALLITLLMRRRGWPVVYLGENLPVDELAGALRTARPDLVLLVAQELSTAAGLIPAGRLLARLKVPLAVAGQIFARRPGLAAAVGGHHVSARLENAADALEEMLQRRMPLPAPPEERSGPLRAAIDGVIAHGGAFRTALASAAPAQGEAGPWQAQAATRLAEAVEASLALGEPEALADELRWIAGLLHNRRANGAFLRGLVARYRAAAAEALADDGAVAVQWLERAATAALADQGP